ncbi:MAG: HEAT repeat domain-containing protein [Planctomycetota bacterium]
MSPRRARVACAGIALFAGLGAACSRTEAPDPAPAAVATPSRATPDELARDPRVAHLLAPCSKADPFLADTSDVYAIWASKLVRGDTDVLKQAKVELAAGGAAAIEMLTRLFDQNSDDAFRAPILQNVLAVPTIMSSDAGRPLLVHALGHTQESVRVAAVRGLARHAIASDYDRVVALLPAGPELGQEIVKVLVAADRARLERDFVAWLDAGENRNLWKHLAVILCESNQPDVRARYAEYWPKLDGVIRVHLAAGVALHADVAARAEIEAWRTSDSASKRRMLVEAASRAGLLDVLADRLAHDPEPSIREASARALGERAGDAPRAKLSAGASDGDRGVRIACLAALARLGDEAALNESLELLRGDKASLEAALTILRPVWEREPTIAARAWATLSRLRSGELQPVLVEPAILDRAIGQLPLRAAAEHLVAQARSATGEIQGIEAHRWYVQLLAGAGAPGRELARELWRSEGDVRRRMDFVEAGASDDGAGSRTFLLEVLADERTTPIEILYAFERAVRIGPAEEVAPALKRAALRVTDRLVRPALNCFLWRWYGVE